MNAWETVANKVAAAVNTATNQKKQQATMTATIYY
jgi:hypothetical protein